MGLVTVPQVSDGDTAEASDINTPVNTIANEFNGNIDNANIKSGAAIATSKLATDAGIATGMIADAAVTPAKLLAGTGSSWAWQSWTPTLGSLSGGTTVAKYIQIGKTVHFRFKYTLAGAGVSAIPTFTLPVSANTDYAVDQSLGQATLIDSNSNRYIAEVSMTTVANTAQIRGITTAGAISNPSSTAPFTWGSGDIIWAQGTYEAA